MCRQELRCGVGVAVHFWRFNQAVFQCGEGVAVGMVGGFWSGSLGRQDSPAICLQLSIPVHPG